MKNLISFLLVICPGICFGQHYTIEDILSAPYSTQLASDEAGRQIAWISEEKGIRKIMTAARPDFLARERFATDGDDGQVLSHLTFDHSGKHVYFIKGSATNRAGEVANPASLVNYPKQILYSINLATGELDDLGSHADFVISPDDTYLLIPKGSTLSRLDVSTETLRPLITMRGTFAHITFSPDSSAILFTSNRGDHSFIGHYRMGTDRIEWLAPSVDKDMLAQWSPDGNQVAFIRSPGDRRGDLQDITSGNPFALMVYDLESRQAHEIWKSPADDGGFAQYYAAEPLRWARTGRLVFYSEHDGWMSLYTILPDGSGLRRVIDGMCEQEHSHMNQTGTRLVFSSNCRDLNDRDIYVHDLVAGTTTALTHSATLETDPVQLEGEQVAFRRAGFNYMPQIVVDSTVIFPRDWPLRFPKSHLTKPLNVTFKAADGLEIHGQLFVKDRITPKPGILFMHGGPIRQMLPGFHYSSYYAFAYAMNQYLANEGYVVLSVNYRAGIGYGRAFRRAPAQGPRGASEYQDIVAAARYLQTLSYVDPDKLGLWGGSYGGLLTAQGLARNSDIFKAGVDFHGVHDWAWRAEDFSEGGFWGITPALMDTAYQSSPVADVSTWTSPVLFIHGDDDRNVMFGQTVDLVERLRARGTYHEILVLPDEVHGFYRWQSWIDSYRATASFFDRFLK